MGAWALLHEVPYGTLTGRVTSNLKKRTRAGTSGRPSPLNETQVEVVADCIARADRANKGKSMPKVIDMVQEMHPELDRKQARDAYANTVKQQNSHRLTRVVQAQKKRQHGHQSQRNHSGAVTVWSSPCGLSWWH